MWLFTSVSTQNISASQFIDVNTKQADTVQPGLSGHIGQEVVLRYAKMLIIKYLILYVLSLLRGNELIIAMRNCQTAIQVPKMYSRCFC